MLHFTLSSGNLVYAAASSSSLSLLTMSMDPSFSTAGREVDILTGKERPDPGRILHIRSELCCPVAMVTADKWKGKKKEQTYSNICHFPIVLKGIADS